MHIPGGQVGQGAAAGVFVFDPRRAAWCRWVLGCLRMRACTILSSALITYSLAANGASSKRRAYRSSTRAALVVKSGSRGKIQDRCCQGLIASAESQRQMVVPEIEATMPCSMAVRARSGQCQRASGTPAVEGSSQASALTATTISGRGSGVVLPGVVPYLQKNLQPRVYPPCSRSVDPSYSAEGDFSGGELKGGRADPELEVPDLKCEVQR